MDTLCMAWPCAEELDKDDGYHLPTAYDAEGKVAQSKRYEVLTARYRDVEAEEQQETPWAQQEQYEAEQIKKAITNVGAKDRKAKGGGCMGSTVLAHHALHGRRGERRLVGSWTELC